MTQYDESEEQQRNKILAEEWAKTVKQIHAHSLDSIWYDDRPEDTAEGTRTVLDVEYNDGSVRRTLDNDEVVIMGIQLTGQDLVDKFVKYR
jgi:2-polyprenyl-3-methyl-5-hydroxy-6-metoxy-1,4-benzoquinol methylase